jgi:tight adherence protein B
MTPVTILIFGGILAFLLLAVGLVVSATSENTMVEERLGRYLEEEEVETAEKDRSSPLGDWLNAKLEKSSVGGGIGRELARADLKLKPAEYFATMAILGVGGAFIGWYIGGKSVLFGIIGLFVGMYLPKMYVKRSQGQRLQHFNDQLADMLNLMVNGLRAGYSTMQAMEAVSKEMPAPISDEFRRVVQEMQLGLDTISYTIRERVRIKGEIRVMTSQVMYSGRFLAMMPLLIAGALWLLNRPYMMEFFNPETRIPGLVMLTIGGMMIAAGYFVMTRIATIEV